MAYDFFEKLPEHMANAPMLIDNGDKVTVITDYAMQDTEGHASYVIAGVWKNQQMENDTVNLVKSVYPRNNLAAHIEKAAEAGKLVITNKDKAEQMLATIGEQYSKVSRIVSLARETLSQDSGIVKGKRIATGRSAPRNDTPLGDGRSGTQAVPVTEETTAVNTDPAQHTPQEQAVIDAYQGAVDENLKNLFESYLQNPKQGFSRHNISSVSEKQSADASRLLGGAYDGYTNAINSNGVKHIINEHGPNGKADQSMADLNDPARIAYVLDNYDTVEQVTYESGDPDLSAEFRTKNNEPAPMLKYSKKVNGTYYVVEAIPESKHKKFWVVSAYMKTDSGTQASDAQSPGNTPNASLAYSLSAKSNLSQNGTEVKGRDGYTVVDVRNGELMLQDANGKTVAASQAEFADPQTRAIYLEIGKVADSPAAAQVLLQLIDPSAQSAFVQGKGVAEAYMYGKAGFTMAEMLQRGSFVNDLTQEQQVKAFTQGQLYGRNGIFANYKGKNAGIRPSMDAQSLKRKANTAYKALDRAGKALGTQIFIKDMPTNELGQYVNGKIYINSKVLNDSNVAKAIAYVVAHEITHRLQKIAPEAYAEYRKYILDTRGDAEAMIREFQENYAGNRKKMRSELYAELKSQGLSEMEIEQKIKLELNGPEELSRIAAMDEIAAEGTLDFIEDTELFREFIGKGEKYRNIGQKLADAFREVIAKIKKFFAGESARDAAAQESLGTDLSTAQRALQLWEEALRQGTEAVKNAPQREAAEGAVQKSITLNIVKAIQEIPNKSVNEFTTSDIDKTKAFAKMYWERMGTKSPFFRAWFGDWRACDISDVKTVEVESIDIENVVMQTGEYSNLDTGWNIHAGSLMYGDTAHHARGTKISVKVLNSVRSILENAVLLDTETSNRNKNSKSIGTAFMHKLYTPIKYNGDLYIAKIAVEEYLNVGDGKIKHRGYNLKAIKIEAVNGSLANTESATASVVETASVNSVAELHTLVKKWDVEFHPKPVNKALLNEDGTPKKFYHGTSAKFTVFDPAEMRGREGSFFFAENQEDAQAYGSNVYEVYLHGENLADYDNQPSEFYRLKTKREQVAWLKERGYDGWYADMDSGGWGEVSVFENTQVKSATDNIGTFDGGNPDVRYSIPGTKDIMQKDRERGATEADLRNMIALLKMQTAEGKEIKFLPSQVQKAAKSLLERANVSGSSTELKAMLTEFYQKVARNGQIPTPEQIRQWARPVAQWLYENHQAEVDPDAKEILKELRGLKLNLDDTQRQEAEFLQGSYADYRRAVYGGGVVLKKSDANFQLLYFLQIPGVNTDELPAHWQRRLPHRRFPLSKHRTVYPAPVSPVRESGKPEHPHGLLQPCLCQSIPRGYTQTRPSYS